MKIYCFDEVYEVFYRAFKETCKIGNSKRIMRVFASIVSPIMFYKLYIIISFISLTRILITVVVICIIWATCCAFLENISLIITRVFEKAWSYIVQRPFFFYSNLYQWLWFHFLTPFGKFIHVFMYEFSLLPHIFLTDSNSIIKLFPFSFNVNSY